MFVPFIIHHRTGGVSCGARSEGARGAGTRNAVARSSAWAGGAPGRIEVLSFFITIVSIMFLSLLSYKYNFDMHTPLPSFFSLFSLKKIY